MNKSIALSYVFTTYNKLSYLQVTLPVLIAARKDDEEIVVIDGGSKDGTKEYLAALYQEQKIQQYISEPDKGESHGINKGMLLANGSLIKILTDDDAYHFGAIGKCKEFMLQHPEIDVLGFDGYGYGISNEVPCFEKRDSVSKYREWKEKGTPFIFCGLSLLIRKSAIPLIGLFSTNVKIIDFEYTIRITAGKGKLAWYSGGYYVNIANEDSNSIRFWKLCNIETERANYMYQGILPLVQFKHIDAVKELVRPLKRLITRPVKVANTLAYDTAFKNALDKLHNGVYGEFYY
ncbi:glycosyltransferase [Mucilaginibacter sp. AW1-3]